MLEKSPELNPEARDLLSDIESYYDNQNEYYENALHRVKQGDEVLVIRNFDADMGVVIDYFRDNRWLGYIDYEYGVGAEIYIGDKCITKEPIDLESAIKTLQKNEN